MNNDSFLRKILFWKKNKSKFISKCFLAIKLKHSGKYALIPDNFNLDEHLRNFPLTNYDFEFVDNKIRSKSESLIFDKDRLLFMLSLISRIPARNKRNIFKDGYVPINSKLIRDKIIKDYKAYLNYLIDTRILECDNQYIKGEKSRGYKFTSLYQNSPLVKIPYIGHINKDTIPIPEKVYEELEDGRIIESDNPLLNYPYLKYWYEQNKLSVNLSRVLKYARYYTQKKLDAGIDNWDKHKNKEYKIDPLVQERAVQYNLIDLDEHQYNAKIDLKVHRLHSVITNMQSLYRNFIKYNNQTLVNIDIKNSQPYLATILFNLEFWQEKSNQFNYTHLKKNIQESITIKDKEGYTLYFMIGNYLENKNHQEVNSYIDKVSEGIFYEYIIDLIQDKLSMNIERKESKTMMFEVLFSENKFLNQPMFKHKKMFAEIHPYIYELFELIKSIKHNTLACLLQAIESEIILHRCCKRIWEESNHEIPIFTIHDSIVTTLGNEEFVSKIMYEELEKVIGIPPKLDIEILNEESNKLDKEILDKINLETIDLIQ